MTDKFLLFYCLLIVALVRIGLTLFSYRTLRRHLKQKVHHTALDNNKARRIVWAVAHSARFVPQASCLTQALATQFLLGRAGFRSQIRVGVAMRADGQFVAHAWLVRDGCVVMGGSAQEMQLYATLVDLPGPS